MDYDRFIDAKRSYQMRSRSQPPMFERERVERFHPYERTYARNEKRRMEDESFNYHSEPELSYSDGDDDLEDFFGDESDMEVYGKRRPSYSSRMRRNVSSPNLRVEAGDFIGSRGRSRSRGPVLVEDLYDDTVRDEFDYQPHTARNISHGREELPHEYRLYDELPSIRLSQSRSRGRLFGESSYEEPLYQRPSFRGPSYEGHSYEIPSFDGPSLERISYERPSYEGGQFRIKSEEQLTSQIYESGTYVQHWKEPVKFKAHDEILKPVEWQAKLEILEAQVLDHSSFRDFPRHMEALELNRFFIHVADAHRVVYKVVLNLERMKQANYFSETFNIMVLENQRRNVARLASISLRSVTVFSNKIANLLLNESHLSFHEARAFLRSCYEFLLATGLDIPSFQDTYSYCSDGHIWYSYVRSREGILSAIMYATRAIGYLLDIATISFCGAHLEPFDEVYFERISPTGHYRIPCSADGSVIELQPRTFQCLEGFLQGRSVWVFSSSDADYSGISSNKPLYLSTTPDEFANVWGPMWKSISPLDPRTILRYIVSPGFIIPWRRTPGQPTLLPNEVHCHWTKDTYDIDSILSQTIHGRVERLLIGAHSTLIKNISCQPSKQKFFSIMSRRMALKDLGLNHGSWALGPVNVSAAVSSSSLLPISFTATVGTTVTKKPPKSLRDRLCTVMVADPRDVVLDYLDEYWGVEISACTGHARRIPLSKLLSSQTMQEYLHRRVQWSSSDKSKYFHALQKTDSGSAFDNLYRDGSDDQKKNYDAALKLSMAALAETRVKSGHLRALWAWNGKAYIISFRVSDHQWAGLLTDTLTTCSLVIVNQTCLECSAAVTQHRPEVPIGKPTVFETTLVINPDARLPVGLQNSPGYLSERQISRRLREGDTFDIKDHGRVCVLRTPIDARGRPIGVFVKLVTTFIPATRQSVKNFFLKVRGRDEMDTFHREYRDDIRDQSESWFYVFVVSDPRQPGPWMTR